MIVVPPRSHAAEGGLAYVTCLVGVEGQSLVRSHESHARPVAVSQTSGALIHAPR